MPAAAPDDPRLTCPSCGRVWWPDPDDVLGHRCPACGGLHLPAHAVEQVLLAERGWSIGELRAAASEPSSGACASCGGGLAFVQVDDTRVELCARCGGVWLEPGELEQVSYGRHRERETPPELAREVLLATEGRRRVFVPSHRSGRELFGRAVTALFGVPFLPLGIGAVMVAEGFFGRNAFVVDPKGERVGLRYGLREREWVPFDRVTHVDVVPTGDDGAGAPIGYYVRVIAEWPEAPRLFVRDRVTAHRYAFQLSQLVGVRVDAVRGGKA